MPAAPPGLARESRFRRGFSSRVKAQTRSSAGPSCSSSRRKPSTLTLEDAKQRALATSKGLGLANLGIQEKARGDSRRQDGLPPEAPRQRHLFSLQLQSRRRQHRADGAARHPARRVTHGRGHRHQPGQQPPLPHARPAHHEADRRQRGRQDRQGRRADRPGAARQGDPRTTLRGRPGVLRPARRPSRSKPPCGSRSATPSNSPGRTHRPKSAWRRSRPGRP